MTNHTKTKKASTKKRTHIIESDNISKDTRNAFLQFNSWRIVPLTEAGAERLAEDLFNWCLTNEEALCFDEYLVHKRLSSCTYYKWVDKFPKLKEVHVWTMKVLGARREKGGLLNKLNPLLVKFTMPYYSPEIKELVQFYADIKKPEDDILAASKIIVNMHKVPESNLVPVKIKEEE